MKAKAPWLPGYLGAILIAVLTSMGSPSSGRPGEPLKVIPIRRVGYLPTDEQIVQGCLLKHVNPICADTQGNIYVADWNYCVVYKFSSSGVLLGSFGRKGQGPDEYGSINDMAAFSGGIAIHDVSNMRCVLVDSLGKILSSFKLRKQYRGLAVSKDATKIYMEPVSGDALVDVLDTHGNDQSSYGKKIDFENEHNALNDVFLSVNEAGEVWAAWKFFTVIRGYSAEGKLISEIRIKDAALEAHITKNEKAAASPAVSNSVSLIGINNGFYVDEEGCYTFLYGENRQPRILRYDREGNQAAVYEIADNVEKEIYVNLLVSGKGQETTFSVLQGFPEPRVDIYKISSSGR